MLDAQTRNETLDDTNRLLNSPDRDPRLQPESLSRVATFVLAGGRGERLGVLSDGRAKPALPFGTQGRLLDFTLENCARASVPYALVLGQYQWRSVQQAVVSSAPVRSTALRAHLRVSRSARGTGGASYRGTADAVYQNLDVLGAQTEAALVLAGDHVYSMDYRDLVATHQKTGADVTIAVAPIARDDVRRFGVVQLDGDGRVSAFEEKPDESTSRLASMGIYVFNPDYLRRTLARDAIEPRSRHDFGHDILPHALRDDANIAAHRFEGYWRDVGTVDAYWNASMDLVDAESDADIDGLSGAIVERSVIAPGAEVEPGAVVRDSVVLAGARIGSGAIVERAIVDEGASIGRGAIIRPDGAPRESEHAQYLPPTVIGRAAQLPSDIRIGAGSTIWPEVDEELRGITSLAPGTRVRRTPLRHGQSSVVRHQRAAMGDRALSR